MTADDFFTGLFGSLAQRGAKAWSLRGIRFDAAVALAFDKLVELAPLNHLDVAFRIRPHSLHGDSAVVRDSLYSAAQRDIVSLDNPEYQTVRLKIGSIEGRRLLEQVPGGAYLFNKVAVAFNQAYDLQPA